MNKPTKVLFQNQVKNLSLIICLWMVWSTRAQLSATEFEEFTPEFANKGLKLSYEVNYGICKQGTQISPLSKTTNNDQNNGIALKCR